MSSYDQLLNTDRFSDIKNVMDIIIDLQKSKDECVATTKNEILKFLESKMKTLIYDLDLTCLCDVLSKYIGITVSTYYDRSDCALLDPLSDYLNDEFSKHIKNMTDLQILANVFNCDSRAFISIIIIDKSEDIEAVWEDIDLIANLYQKFSHR